MDQHITTPITEEVTKKLHSGDYVYITGTIYVARDAAHKRMIEALDRGDQLPLDIKDATIYYMGPSPAREGRPIGSAGPTTATRMDKYAPTLLDLGEKAMIGKGKRSKEVIDAIIRNHAVYFAAEVTRPSNAVSFTRIRMMIPSVVINISSSSFTTDFTPIRFPDFSVIL